MFKKVLRDVYTSVSACNFSTWSPPFFVSLREKLTFIREKRRIIAQIYRRRLPVASSILKIVLKIRSIINRFPGASAPSATRSGGKRIYLARLDCYDEPAISTHLGWQKKTKRFERERERRKLKNLLRLVRWQMRVVVALWIFSSVIRHLSGFNIGREISWLFLAWCN